MAEVINQTIELMRAPPGSKIELMEDRLGIIVFLPDGSLRTAELTPTLDGFKVLTNVVPKIMIAAGKAD
jgi:hypothetical protein